MRKAYRIIPFTGGANVAGLLLHLDPYHVVNVARVVPVPRHDKLQRFARAKRLVIAQIGNDRRLTG